MGTGDCINIFMAAQPCNTANQELGIASISSWLLSPVTLQKGTGDCINIFMATQPCNTANGYWRLHQYLCGYSALSHCKWVLGIASISLWLLSPVTLQMGTGDCINIFMAAQPCNTANGIWGLHQYLYGCSALSHCKWVLGLASFFFYGYSALSHCKWELRIASISPWLLSPVTLQMGTGDCINIFMAVQPCNTANGYWGLHQYLYGYSALSHCKWELEIASISSCLLSPVTPANGYWGLHQCLHGCSAL